MIPQDDFTPHGYLDNPYHSWKLNPSGVLRSLPPLGMGWHVPNLGSYVRNQFQYTAHLTIGLKINKTVLVTPEDFQRHNCTITSHLHTKNRFEYTCTIPQYQLTLTARYLLIHEHALGCILTLSTTLRQPFTITCYLIHTHTHNPFTSRLWEHGLYALQAPEHACAMLGLASEGDVFIHGVRPAGTSSLEIGDIGYAISLDDISAWARGKHVPAPQVTQSQEGTGWQVRTLALPCTITVGAQFIAPPIPVPTTTHAPPPIPGPAATLHVVLARGVSQDQAYQHWQDGMEQHTSAEARHQAADEAFWQQAPQLSGDWPASWRRGFVYDFETLRMVMRPPAGIIPHIWDGMQIQAPRTVLAEAAMDTLFLSYADPELAAEVILGHFESAPHANLPCMREDGSYNMVADDGQICGTAPEWGFPLWCLDQLVRRSGNLHWLRRLYPRVAAYLRWWLEHRVDSEGWLVYACSWESGQDVSSRFGPQQTGGTIIEHVRPVDLQASMAQAAQIMARWAIFLAEASPVETVEARCIEAVSGAEQSERLASARTPSVDSPPIDFAAEAAWWEHVAGEFTARTRQIWHNGWFRGYDSVAREWSTQRDAMHLAPVFCGAASQEQVEQLRPFLVQPPLHSNGWAPLSWPPVVMALAGAASAAHMPLEAAELAYRYIDGSYTSTDSREPDEHGGLPGVTREYRRVVQGKYGSHTYANAGIEGYGWGALSIHLLLRYLLGLREQEAGVLTVAPALPQALRRAGAVYHVEPVPWGNYVLSIECIVKDAQRYQIRLRCIVPAASLGDAQEKAIQQVTEEYERKWEGVWGEGRTLRLPHLTAAST